MSHKPSQNPDRSAVRPEVEVSQSQSVDRRVDRHRVGATWIAGKGTHFRVWAPEHDRAEVAFESDPARSDARTFELKRTEAGYFEATVSEASPGMLYRFRLDGGDLLPDPASRFQPEGPHGPSEIIDPAEFSWTDDAWTGIPPSRRVVYEMHIGTFTKAGTWKAAEAELPVLAALGITIIQVMPVADFTGEFGWGYDGVNFFAPTRLYGRPEDVRRFVNSAHQLGIGVILDVVYNHYGANGNYLPRFSSAYESKTHTNEWGGAINFDGPDAGPVRAYFVQNARYWIEEFHFDGLRLDATQEIHDSSPVHILSEVSDAVRQLSDRHFLLIAENEPQQARLIRPRSQGGYGIDAIVNDDLHHSAMVAITGKTEAYYSDYLGKPQELISAAKYGFLFQGQRYHWQEARRGSPALDLPPTAFITFLQNHDQVANTPTGVRLHELTSPGRLRAITAFVLLTPQTPMLFQGQEFCASQPFCYFADHSDEMAEKVRAGRLESLKQFPTAALEETLLRVPDPCARSTLQLSQLDHAERLEKMHWWQLHADLIRLRSTDAVISKPEHFQVDGSVLGEACLALRWISSKASTRLLVLNLGASLTLGSIPDPLMAPPLECRWTTLWSSDSAEYQGPGTPELETDDGWRIPGEAAVLLTPVAREHQS